MEVLLDSFFISVLDGGCQLHAPADLSSVKEHAVSVGWAGVIAVLDLLLLPEIDPQTVPQPVAYTGAFPAVYCEVFLLCCV
jgi:hypothetical protein